MKKWLKTGKKALSVFMAVMMVLTAWVWVAPTEASAAAGTYTVVIKLMIADNYDMENSAATIKVSYYGNNGSDSTASTSTSSQFSIAENSLKEDDCTRTFTISNCPGYPAAILFGDAGFKSNNSIWNSHLNVEVTVNGTTVYNDKPNGGYTFNVGAGKTVGNLSLSGDSDWTNNKPYAKTITWSNTPEAMTCPKTGSTTQTVAASAKDQYGVQMYDPSWSVTSDRDTSGLAVSSAGVITVTNATNVDSGSYSTQTGKVTATWGSKSETKDFTITDSYYTATFNYKSADGSDTSATRSNYHGSTITAPTATDYDLGDYHYVFSKWSPTFASTITKDVTYTAQYTSTFVGADYSAVNEAIAAADAIKANYGTEYELKYTLASRVALDSAINAVVTGLGRTRQSDVDGYADTINAKIAALAPNKFDVIFLDKDGAILLYDKDVEYKEAVTAPSFPDDQRVYYDSTNHYTFTGWDTDEYASVVDDLVIQPVFTAEAHTFTTETVPSTCVQKGATKYICSCGYSYIDGETNYGDHVWETEFTTDLEPTCTVAGSKSIHCTLCDAQKDITVIDPLGHQWSSQSIAVEASCGKIGIMTRVCDDCMFCEHTIIPALEHDYEKTTVPATCTAKGYDEYVCQRTGCGHSYRDNYTNVIAHTYGAWETVSEAYCGITGVKKQTCTECGFISLGSIPALEHNLKDWVAVVTETCTGKGYQIKTCSLCENVIEEKWIDALGHNYVEKTVVAPTCTSKGYTVEECNRANCGAQKITNETAALNHAWTSTEHEADCTHSAYIEHVCGNDSTHNYIEYVNGSVALTHDFTGKETEISAATCTADGEKTVECSRCDVTTNVIIPKLGHSYSAWEKIDATNDKVGSWSHKCSICGKVETLEIPAGGHEFDNGTVTKAATCVEAGTMLYKCTAHENCGITLEVTIPVTQHTVAQKVVEATCTAPGSVEAYCSACNKSFDIKPTPAKAHNPVVKETVAPTCITSGYTVYACDCGTFSYNEYDESQPATGHTSWTETGRKAATCTEDGHIKYECSVCKAPKEEILPKTGHSFTENTAKATAATCTSLATKTYECDCGASYVEYYGELAAHNYNTLVKTVPATNDSLGYEEYKCACGLTKITILEATGTHVFDEKIADECIAPTCTENGIDVFKCTAHDNCGVKSSILVPRLGHTVEAVYNAPTCKAEGSSAAYCTTCGETINSMVISATGIHDWNEGVETTAPTCEGEGVKTYTCLVCGDTKTAAIPAKGHDLTTTVEDATCEANGKVMITCSRCDDTDVEKTIYLAKKNHDWNEGVETTAPSCEVEGEKTFTCTLCGAEKTEAIPAKGHTWGDWVVTPSTNSAKGSVSRSCTICGAKETVDIPEGNHSLVVDTDKSSDASCIAEGKLVYKCENHADCGITVTVITAKLQHKSETKTVTEADCVTNGKVETRCTECGTLLVETTIPAKGHAYNKVEITKEAGCESTGVRTYKCACGDSRTEAIPAKGHSYKTTTTPATCTAPGSVVTECTVCKSDAVKETTVLPAMGHDFTDTETPVKSADCENDGSKTVKCSRCDVTTNVIIPKFGHSYSDWVKTDATNDTDGSWYHKCSTCNKEETLVIPAGGHNLVETENVPSKCNEKGHITYKCNAHENCSVTVTVELDFAQHTVVEDNKKATCTQNGYAKTYCSVCNKEFNNYEIPATQHSYKGEVTLSATCTREGVKTYTCSKCNDTYTEPVAMVQHSYNVEKETAATCTSSGYTTYKCDTCESRYDVITAEAKGHSYTEKVNSTATCISGGTLTLKCADCDATMETAVPALGHDYVLNGTTAANCTAAATETYKCSRCTSSYTISVGDKAEHTFSEWKVIAEATEDALGYKTRSCTKCGKIELETIDAIGNHKFDKFVSETPATCTDPGEIVYDCSAHDDCGLTSTVVIPALGHDMEETAAAVAPTCSTDGSTAVYTCKNGCGKVEGGEKIAAIGHAYGEGVVTHATCDEAGKVVYTCGTCNATYTTVLAKNENAHQYVTTVVDATCTKEGSVIAKCKLCDDITVEETLPMIEHTWVVDSTEAATCEADGSTNYKCQNCDATKSVVIAKLGHNMVAGASVDATCTENGYTPYTCTNDKCTHAYNVYNTPAKAHNYVQVENSSTATCTAGGTVTLKCSDCGKEITAEVPALGHDWGEWSVDVNPTAAAEGTKIRSCKRNGCTETETVTLPKLGHDMVKSTEKSTAATCTSEGTDVYVCTTHTDCGYTYFVKVAPVAHTYGEGVETEKATCTTDGEMTYTCDCGAKITEVIPKTGHSLSTERTEATCKVKGSVVTSCADCTYKIETDLGLGAHKLTVVSEAESTCTANGIVNIKCEVCGDSAGTVEIPAKGHDFSGAESDIIDATCESVGSKKVKCVNCDEKTTVEIPANGHNYVAGNSFAATCTESGYTVFTCANNCGNSYSRLDSKPNGHVWGEGTVKSAATCEGEGVMLVKCNNCDASYEKAISALGHIWGAWATTKNPTATEDGEMTRPCIRGCGATETAPIPALGGGSVTYTVTFVADGETVAVQTVNHGGSATAPKINKAPDESGHYSYIWDIDFSNITEDLTVTAIFTAENHTFGNWITDTESTCKVNGLQHRECSVCAYVENGTLPLAAHNYSGIIEQKAPTCTENGYKVVECSVCGKSEKQTLKRLGHIMTYYERVYETCDTDGSLAHYSCARCGKNFEDRDGNLELVVVNVNKLYHTFVIVEGVAPTCTSEGATTYRHCTRCGITQPSEPIPALGHVDANNDHVCDRCSGTYMEGGDIVCVCNCHKVGFFNELIYKILRFFWQLLGKNKTCACGAIHY